MFIELSFGDNDFSLVAEELLKSFYKKTMEKMKDETLFFKTIEFHHKIASIFQGNPEITVKEAEKYIKEKIKDIISTDYVEDADYLNKNIKIRIRKTHTIKWRNGESSFALIIPIGYGNLTPVTVWTE